MRSAGVVDSACGLGPHDHCCVIVTDPRELRPRVLEFLGEGLERRQRVAYVGRRPVDELLADLAQLDGLDDLLAAGALRVRSTSAVYEAAGVPVDPDAQVTHYASETTAALRDGFTGLRVAADATSQVRTPEQRDAFTRYEHLIDRYMARHPFSAMCAYRRDELPDDTISRLATLHPVLHGVAAPFQLFGSDSGALTLRGELDITTVELFEQALECVGRPEGSEVVVDFGGVAFVDHRALLTLARYARRHDVTVRLESEAAVVRRVVAALDITEIMTSVSP